MMSPEENYYMQQGGEEGDGQWKSSQSHNQSGSGPPHASKLNTWANKRNKGGPMYPPPNYNGTDPKGAWQDGNRHTPSDKVPWSDPLQDPSFDSFCDDVFGMSLGGAPGPKMGPHNNGTPHQWGRGEINQSTPWDIDNSRGNFNPDGLPGSAPRFIQPVSMDNGTGQWRSWDAEGTFQKDFHHNVGYPPYMPGPGKMHGNFYNGAGASNFTMQPGFPPERMMRNGPPHMQPSGNQQQPWMGNKYGNENRFQTYGAPPQTGPMNMVPPSMVGQRGAFMAPPPLGGAHPHPGMQPPPMHQMPPNPHMNAPAPQSGHQGGQFSVGTFSTAGLGGMGNFQSNTPAVPPINDDSVWHDPNGDLRKWQRDTGTAAWGDPTKQAGQAIRRWQQADENDPLGSNNPNLSSTATPHSASLPPQQSPDLKKSTTQDEDETTETGWGELPPLNGGGPIQHAPPPGPGPQHGSSGAWMIGSGPAQPQPLAPQNSNAPPQAAWSDPQRSIASTAMPPIYSNPGTGSATPTDWARSNFNFNGSAASHPMINSFDGAPNGGPIVTGQDQTSGSTNEIADKLRMAATKGWIDPAVFCSNNKLSTQTASLLNTLINRLTAFEQTNAKIEQLKRQEASGVANANGSPQRAELDRLIRESTQMSNELSELREKIHMSVEGQRSNKGMSLADELSNMSTMPIGDVPLW